MKWLLILYPPWWRRRYGDEARAVLEQTPLRLRAVLDLLLGALDAWLAQEEPGRDPFGRFTPQARTVVAQAQQEAHSLGHDFMGTEHVLLGILAEPGGVAAQALLSLGVSHASVRAWVLQHIGPSWQPSPTCLRMTPRTKRVFGLSRAAAHQLGKEHIAPEHLLLGLLEEGQGVAVEILTELGTNPDRVRERIARMTER